MATLGTSALTYADWAKRLDDNYKIATIIELLSQTNEILDDMMVVEGNLPTGHKTTVRTGLPQATWRLLNQGVPSGKSTTAQIVDTCGNLETYSVIDKDIADLNGNTAEFRLSEVKAFLEGMSQQVAATLIYGNQFVNPERFTGFAPRYSTKTAATSQTAANVLDAGGTASTNTSIWLNVWGSDTCHATFPKGKVTGLQHRDMGEWPISDTSGHLPSLPRPLQMGDRAGPSRLAVRRAYREHRRDPAYRRVRCESDQPGRSRALSPADRPDRRHAIQTSDSPEVRAYDGPRR
jgi:hypothetical protein